MNQSTQRAVANSTSSMDRQAVTPAARALPLTSLTSAAQTAPGHMLGGLPLGHSVNAGSGINNALRVPARAYAIPRTPAAG